ncbi:DsbA family protein [Actinomadura madurae]|uniref:DsbA family protein n=1 Tax=Actinomadura madurae TaxID=1993 RepID=UPI0020D220B3|nr:DsbA family protein [Actinomadura madurae]MCP9971533.1 DsbA family protein [Actinomadura madurae]
MGNPPNPPWPGQPGPGGPQPPYGPPPVPPGGPAPGMPGGPGWRPGPPPPPRKGGGGLVVALVGGGLVLVLVLVAAVVLVVQSGDDEGGGGGGGTEVPLRVGKIAGGAEARPLADGSLEMARPGVTAPVVDIYEDFACPPCGAFDRRHDPMLKQLAVAGRAKVVFHPMLIFGESAQPGARQLAAGRRGAALRRRRRALALLPGRPLRPPAGEREHHGLHDGRAALLREAAGTDRRRLHVLREGAEPRRQREDRQPGLHILRGPGHAERADQRADARLVRHREPGGAAPRHRGRVLTGPGREAR